jgi:hypothetical protein
VDRRLRLDSASDLDLSCISPFGSHGMSSRWRYQEGEVASRALRAVADHGRVPQQASRRNSWVELDLPQSISGRGRRLADSASWQVEQRSGTLRVCTKENYLRQKPNLLGIRPVDAPGLRPGTGYEILGTLMNQEHLTTPAIRVVVERELARLEDLGDSDTAALLARSASAYRVSVFRSSCACWALRSISYSALSRPKRVVPSASLPSRSSMKSVWTL